MPREEGWPGGSKESVSLLAFFLRLLSLLTCFPSFLFVRSFLSSFLTCLFTASCLRLRPRRNRRGRRSRKIKSEYPGVQKAGAGRRERPFADGRPAGRSSVFCGFRGLSRVPGTGFRARFRRQGGSAPGSFVDAPGKPLVAFQEFETGIDGRFVPDAGGRYGRSAGIRAFRRVCLSFVAAFPGRGGGAGEEGGFEKIKQTETFHIEKNPLFSQFSPKIAAKTRRFCLL